MAFFMKNMWMLLWKENSECWLLGVSSLFWEHTRYTLICSFALLFFLALPFPTYLHFILLPALVPGQKRSKEKMLAISECSNFSDPFQIHVRLRIFPITHISTTVFCKIHKYKADWWKKHGVLSLIPFFYF